MPSRIHRLGHDGIDLLLHPHERLPHAIVVREYQREAGVLRQVLRRRLIVQIVQLLEEAVDVILQLPHRPPEVPGVVRGLRIGVPGHARGVEPPLLLPVLGEYLVEDDVVHLLGHVAGVLVEDHA